MVIKQFFKNNWQYFLFNTIILLIFTIFYGKFGDIIVDSFREAYIPEQVANGQILYKNIFSIYAPFAYLFNALIFKIFGSNLKVLYFLGLFFSIGIINITYLTSNLFLEKKYSFSIILLIISGAILSPNVFNYIFPYSYGILYGLFFILLSIYFLLKNKISLAFVFCALAISSKYEFLLFLPLLIFYTRKQNILKNISYLFLTFGLIFTPFLIQKVGLNNIVASFQIITNMTSTKTLYWFYSIMGLTFRIELIPIYLINFIKLLIPILFLYKFYNVYSIIITFVYFYFLVSPEIFLYIFPLILILFIVKFKKLNKNERFFIFASLLISTKVFFATTIQSYGTFFLPFAFISIYILCPQKIQKSLFIIFLALSLNFGINNIKQLNQKNYKIVTTKGIIYTSPYYGKSIDYMIKILKKNTKSTDKVIIYPECLSVNYLSDRNSDNKFYSLIPLYVETFGEDIITKRLSLTKPEYIIINNYDTSNYYYSLFGIDYAQNILKFINNNYKLKTKIGDNFVFTVFENKY